jgi:hypothetical protein
MSYGLKAFRAALFAGCAVYASGVAAQAPSNEELYKLVMGLKAEQEKLREENRRVKAEADEARSELRRLRGEQKATSAKVDAVAKATPVKAVTKGGQVVAYEPANSCAAYGVGYYAVGGSGTCVRVGGYVRADAQYTPQQKVYQLEEVNAATRRQPRTAVLTVGQEGGVQDTTGTEIRGRADLDAVTPTAFGDARVSLKLRIASLTGTRTATIANNGVYGYDPGVLLKALPEAAFMSVAGFTVGIAPSNYALMPTNMYTSTPWAQYTNGVAQIAYKHDFGQGWSVTGAVERAKDWAYSDSWNRPSTAFNLVGNAKWEQQWGWIALQGVFSGNSVEKGGPGIQPQAPEPLGSPVSELYGGEGSGQQRYNAGAVGVTANFKVKALGERDQLWLTANYANGNLGALLAAGGLSNISTSNNGSLFGGILRVDQNMMVVSGYGPGTLGRNPAQPYQVKNVTGFNVAAMMTHYWTDRWRSNFNAGYVQINPPRSMAYDGYTEMQDNNPIPMWGRGQLYSLAGSLIYSIAENWDVGAEMGYAYLRNQIQNAPANWQINATNGPPQVQSGVGRLPGLSQSNAIFRMRMDRLF